MKKKLLIVLIAVVGLITLPLIGLASFDNTVLVTSDEIINDNFVQYADTITIEGHVDGDLVAVAGRLIVNGTVSGDVIAAAGSVTISGKVLGNIRIASPHVIIRGDISKNATIFANDLTITSDGSIGWSLAYVGGEVEVAGPVYGNITGQSTSLSLASTVGSDVHAKVNNNSLLLSSEAEISGDLKYVSDEEMTFETGQVAGLIEYQKSSETFNDLQGLFVGSAYFFSIAAFLGLILVGLLILSVFPKSTDRVVKGMISKPMSGIGWGILYLIGIPVAVAILFASIIGIPLGLITLVSFAIVLYISRIFIALLIGRYIINLFLKKHSLSPIIPFLLGLIVFYLITWLPYLGNLVTFVAMAWVMSSLTKIIIQDTKKLNHTDSEDKK
ncbi:polymer-forming cytoskeletal protein [Patescibacteria group bacterium]|nr:polymer-forming cytoskeletal protein [Patescibacteria group bacterium]MBU1890230.1 polymer-forming cytoskeletal protein [Patescibacteria group bacterium]